MSIEPSLRTVILAAVEPSAASDQVIHSAASMARIVPGAELHFVHVIDRADHLPEGRSYLDKVVVQAMGLTTATTSGHLPVGKPVERILQIAVDIAADLLVVGTHQKKGLSRLVGSVSQRVLSDAPCPVLLARVKETVVTVPEIEPACTDCVATQFATRGERLWCERHATRHIHGRLHYGFADGFGAGSMFVRRSSSS